MFRNNFDSLTTLALSVAVYLERYACEQVKDIDHVYSILSAKHREVDVKHLLGMVLRRYNPLETHRTNMELIVHNNRLQVILR